MNREAPLSHSYFSQSVLPPKRSLALLESRCLLELGYFINSIAHLKQAPEGDGHPVLVLPGFLTNDSVTFPLRWYLKYLGYEPLAWKKGFVRSLTIDAFQGIIRQILEKHEATGQKVSLIGWSLGGIYARLAAHEAPHAVRQVITLGTPFSKIMHSSIVVKIFEFLNKSKVEHFDNDLLTKVTSPTPIPSTSIFSKSDGIVAWECSVNDQYHPANEHVEIKGSHIGLCYNPGALITIADRLSQPSDQWRRFTLQRVFNQEIHNHTELFVNLLEKFIIHN